MSGSTRATRAWRVLVALSSIALAVTVLAGCQGGAEPLDDGVTAFDLTAASALEQARAGGASAEQIRILEAAQASRTVGAEALHNANRAAAECLTAQGFQVEFEDYVSNAGLVVPAYVVLAGEIDDDLALDLQMGCEYSENYWVNQLFWTQPSSIAINNAYLVKQTPVLIECVMRNGGDASEGDDTRVVLDAAQRLLVSSGGAIDCLYEAKIDVY